MTKRCRPYNKSLLKKKFYIMLDEQKTLGKYHGRFPSYKLCKNKMNADTVSWLVTCFLGILAERAVRWS